MTRKRKYTREILEPAVKANQSCAGVLRTLGITSSSGGMNSLIKKRIKELNIDTSHFTGQAHLKGKHHHWTKKKSLEEVMKENSSYSRCHLKKRLLSNGLLVNKCSCCNQEPIWNGKKLIMVLDHINGVGNDNRIENLRLLCPNCNSQQDTFCGRKNKQEEHPRRNKDGHLKNFEQECDYCKIKFRSIRKQKFCSYKCFRAHQRKAIPTKEELEKMISNTNIFELGIKFGVSTTTIRNWKKSYGLQ